MKNLEKLGEVHGEILSLTAPSGYTFTIRMQNGNDDDILSNVKLAGDGTSTTKFVAGLVVDTDFTESGKLNLDDARNLTLADKFFIMLASRIFSIGQTIKFTYKWYDGLEVDYEEDLGLFIWEYHGDKPFPKKGDDEYFIGRIPESTNNKEKSRTVHLRSNKIVKYDILNGHAERYLMKLLEDKQSVNSGIIARNLEQQMPDNIWVRVQSFKSFTPMDMADIRNDIESFDPPIDLITELEHPGTGEKVEYPIIASTDFFFPREI